MYTHTELVGVRVGVVGGSEVRTCSAVVRGTSRDKKG